MTLRFALPEGPVPAAPRPPGQEPRRWAARVGPPLVVGLAILALWQIIAQSGAVAAFLLPAPAAVWQSFWAALGDGLLISASASTLSESLLGFLVGGAVAIPLGYSLARSPLLARALEPYLAMSQALPAVAIAPLLVLWLGYTMVPIIVLCALIVFFPAVITTTLGIRLLDRDLVDAAHVDGANWWTTLTHIELPLALPSILAGLRASLTYSITGAVVGEFVINGEGLGGLINIARGNLDTPLVFATLFTLALLAAILYGIARVIERLISFAEGQ